MTGFLGVDRAISCFAVRVAKQQCECQVNRRGCSATHVSQDPGACEQRGQVRKVRRAVRVSFAYVSSRLVSSCFVSFRFVCVPFRVGRSTTRLLLSHACRRRRRSRPPVVRGLYRGDSHAEESAAGDRRRDEEAPTPAIRAAGSRSRARGSSISSINKSLTEIILSI